MILKRSCSETYKKQCFFWFFWSLLFRNTIKTMVFLVFLVSGKLFGSRPEGQEFLKHQKNIVFIGFLKSSDQKNQKNHCFLYDSEEVMLRNIQKNNGVTGCSGRDFSESHKKTMFFLVFLVSGRLLGSRREGQEFLKNQKHIVFIRFLKSSDQKKTEKPLFLYGF